ncbi:MAG: response regulator transcription factor [Rhodobacteraceae bacterium]|nr:response regulator transcription factor [Paracoccaceae bacterium]
MQSFANSENVSILLADDHELVRDGIRARLEHIDTFHIVGEVKTGLEAVQKANELKPDLILMDVSMPEMNGLDATRKIRESCPQTSVLMLSIYDTPEYVHGAMQAGAKGYILKDICAREMTTAIKSVASGGYYFSSAVGATLVGGKKIEVSEDPYGLTLREKEVLAGIAKGKPNKEIAEDLGISVRTVESHRLNLREKVGSKNAAQLYKIAADLNLLN